ncbi:hypothetical protein R1flu_020767 [Riccia fluitans]|uniref:Uncharacterized protein n=1 Tax=Riccia fluitans TaxID=41844 RepID=A0ABD1ZR51_9MARC
MVDQNEACLVSLESSRKMLSNDTKNTPSPFIDQNYASFPSPAANKPLPMLEQCSPVQAKRSPVLAIGSPPLAKGSPIRAKGSPLGATPRRLRAPQPNGSSE